MVKELINEEFLLDLFNARGFFELRLVLLGVRVSALVDAFQVVEAPVQVF